MNLQTVNGRRPWDYDPIYDTPKSYTAFCIYRDLGPSRTLQRTWELYEETVLNRPGGTKTRTSSIDRWSTAGKWAERAAAYDEWVRVQLQTKAAQYLLDEYSAQLEEFYRHQLRINKARAEILELGLEKLRSELRRITDDDIRCASIGELATFMNAVSRFAESLGYAWAETLGVQLEGYSATTVPALAIRSSPDEANSTAA